MPDQSNALLLRQAGNSDCTDLIATVAVGFLNRIAGDTGHSMEIQPACGFEVACLWQPQCLDQSLRNASKRFDEPPLNQRWLPVVARQQPDITAGIRHLFIHNTESRESMVLAGAASCG
jgi:hypothetical protein